MPQLPAFIQALTGFILLVLMSAALAEPAWHEHTGTDLRNRLIEGHMSAEGIESEAYLEALARIRTATREDGIDRLPVEHEVDVLISPSGALKMVPVLQ